MSKNGKRKVGECAYCGEQAELSKDHVIPRCLFPRPLPTDMDMITVYACNVCNNQKKSKNDDYLRDMLVCDIWNSDNPLAQEAYQAMLRSAGYNKSVVARLMLSQGRLETKIGPNGEILGYGCRVPLDAKNQKRVEEIFTTIMHGLYYKRWEQRFPDNYHVDVLKLEPQGYLNVLNKLQESGFDSCYRIGDGVFTLKYGYSVEDPASGFHLMSFYDTAFACVMSKPPS